jgi:hypothetical protein
LSQRGRGANEGRGLWGGYRGLTLANRLSELGADVVVLERSPGPRLEGYMIDFFGPGYDTAEAMGLLPAIKDVAYPITEASVVDDGGRRRAGVRPSQVSDVPLLDVMRPDLERILRENLPQAVDLRFGTSPVAGADHGDVVRVTLDDETQLDAESKFLRYLGFHTAAFTFSDPDIHAAVKGRFCLTDTSTDRSVCMRCGTAVSPSSRCTAPRIPHCPQTPGQLCAKHIGVSNGQCPKRLRPAHRQTRCTTTRWPRS